MKHRISLLIFCLFLLFTTGGSRERRLLNRTETTEEKVNLSAPSTEGYGDRNLAVDVLFTGKETPAVVSPEDVEGTGELLGDVSSEDADTQEAEVSKTGSAAQEDAQPILAYGASDPGFMENAPWVSAGITEGSSLSCKGKKKNTIMFYAEFDNVISSMDDYYYLLSADPKEDEPDMIPLSRIEKAQRVKFLLNTADHPEYVQKRYCLAVRTGVGYARITPILVVRYAENLADNTKEYQIAKTKKGIQQDTAMEEVFESNSSQVFINIPTKYLLASGEPPVKYAYDGEVYTFRNLESLRAQVRRYNESGIVVTAQILLDDASPDLILKEARGGDAPFFTWNTREKEARRKMEAIFSYLAECFGKEDCYISNWILGNEINSCNSWNYCGDISGSEYVKIYCEAFQSLYKAVRSRKSGTKLFLCLDHNWNTAMAGYSSRYILENFAKRIKKIQPDLQWNLAYHAYPSPLTEVAFWNNHVTNDISSSIIHMGNLEVLTDYIRENYGAATRILLSEQGFTSTQGEPLQAAALCYAYYIAACNPMIDGFHIRSFLDNEVETSLGLMMGIQGKEAYKVYCYMDTVDTLQYTTPYVKLTGLQSWNEIPNYAPERLHTNYRIEDSE